MDPDRRQRLHELFEAVSGLEPDERAAFLEEACADDGELRREVESLLARDARRAGARTETGQRPAESTAALAARELTADQVLGKFRILEKIGAGGMGEVYRALDTTLDREVALKVLPAEVADDPDRLSRFEREAKSLAALNHPNIVHVYSVEETEETYFFTMELVEGHTLDRRIPEEGMELAGFLELAIPLADALGEAHEEGVTHRDLKPGNIMVDGKGRPKILDFGLAKLRRPGISLELSQLPTQTMTREGLVIGTVPYMSPEQIQGRPLDSRSDIFSLGIVYYEMVTGRRPFEGDTPFAVGSAILTESPPPLAELREGVPGALDEIVRRCLAKDPEDRYQRARDLRVGLEALKHEVDRGAASVARPAMVAAAGRPKRRWWPVVGLATALALILVTGYLLAPRFELSSERGDEPAAAAEAPRKRIVILPFENLGPPEDDYFASGLTDEVTSRLASVSGLAVISRKSAIQYAGADKTIQQIGAELNVGYVLEGTVRWARDRGGSGRVRITPQLIRVADDTHLWVDTFDRVLDDIFEVQSNVAQEVLRRLDVTLLEPERRALESRPTEDLEAYQAFLRGVSYARRPDFYSMENLSQQVQMFERAVELDPTFARAHAALGQIHATLYLMRVDASRERLADAKAAADRALELRPDLPWGHLALAYYYWCFQDADRTLAELASAEKGLPNESIIFEVRGRIRRQQGRWPESVASMERALELDPRDALIATSLGYTHTLLRQYDRAEALYDRSIAVAPVQGSTYVVKSLNYLLWSGDLERSRAALGPVSPAANPIALLQWWTQEILEGSYQAALDLLSSAQLEIILHPGVQVFATAQLLGDTYRLLDKPELARGAYETAAAVLERTLAQSPELPGAHSSLGLVYAGLGRAQDALREGRLGVDLEPLSQNAEVGPLRLAELAQIHLLLGDHDAALDQLEHLLSIPAPVSVPLLAIDPRWAPLRGHPRFEEILEPNE